MSRSKSARTTEHEYFEERLSAYLDGELAPDEHEAVKHHVVTCAACQWELETLGQTIQWTRELPAITVPRVFTIPVAAQPERLPRRRWNLLPVLQGATALIAVLLVFAVTGDLMFGSLRMGSAPEQEAAPISTEVTQEVEAAAEAPAAVEAPVAEPEVEVEAEKIVVETVVETVVVEAEVMMVAPTEAPLAMALPPGEPAATPQPPSAEATAPGAPEEASEGAVSEETAYAADTTAAEAEAAPRLAEETGIGGEAELSLAAPSPVLNVTETLTVAQATEPALAPARELDEAASRGGEVGVNWLRVVEYSLAGVLVLLAAVTLFFTIERRRAR